jgi:transposase
VEVLKYKGCVDMLNKNSGQIDIITYMIFEKLVPKDHLLVKINEIIDFSFVYDLVKDKYSTMGRNSKDPVMMIKILLIEYLYRLSDVEVVSKIKTDIVFRWFLGLKIDDSVPDDTTISHFRITRLSEDDVETFFNEIVKLCFKNDLIKTKRYIVDSTDVAANVNYPSDKNLIIRAFRKLIFELEQIDVNLAKQIIDKYESEIDREYAKADKVRTSKHYEIINRYLELVYIKAYDQLQNNTNFIEAFGLCYDLIDQFVNNKKDKIVSVVDTDARIAHKSPGNIKKGYKDHIIVDEDSEIILASSQTPFNVGDEKKLIELVEKVKNNFNIKPEEVSADKVYGTINNRSYLKDSEIISNIAFYNESSREVKNFGINDIIIAPDVNSITCPNGIVNTDYEIKIEKKSQKEFKVFSFQRKDCDFCSLREQCLPKSTKGKINRRIKSFSVPLRYDAMLNDMKRVQSEDFKVAYNKRYKIERRFSTLVHNFGLRRSRYIKLVGAKKHIMLANIACNIVRMVKLIMQASIATPST